MVQSDLGEYKPLFLQTAWDYVRQLEGGLSVMRESHDASVLETLYISAHSLKSQSLVMGYSSFGTTAHELEKFFKQVKGSDSLLTDDELLKLQGVVASMSTVLTQISSENTEPSMEGEIHIIQELLQKRGVSP